MTYTTAYPAAGDQAGQARRTPELGIQRVVTNTASGQVQFLDARHRTQAHVEDRMKQFKACGARNLPSIDYGRNTAWLQLTAPATSLTAWLRHLALDGDLANASTKTLRFRILSAPARLVTHARRRILKIPPGWQWSADLATAYNRLQALHPDLTRPPPVPNHPEAPGRPWNRRPSTLGHPFKPTPPIHHEMIHKSRRSRSNRSVRTDLGLCHGGVLTSKS